MDRNIALYPWYRFCRDLMFWHGIWFLYFQRNLTPADAILLYVVYDIATTALEVPSGLMSDRWGRRRTLIASSLAGLLGAVLLATGDSFAAFALAQVAMGAAIAFASGTDSALLYESLVATGREDEVGRQELRAWRATFLALSLGAVLGGAMALVSFRLAFAAGALAWAATLLLSLRFSEPVHRDTPVPQGDEVLQVGTLRRAFASPVLRWLFALSVTMYVFSHVPYVFGQPFILAALDRAGWAGEAPLVSGGVSAAMMLVSVAASLLAPRLRQALGLAAILLLAFSLQIAVTGLLALTHSTLAIAVLFLRMVPDSLSKPFVLASIQPMLGNDGRATYLSLQSLAGRLVFAATLWAASSAGQGPEDMDFPALQSVLGAYALAGLVALAMLALAARRVGIGAD
ncbi:MAG: MFS transporter [Paracoccaceae bacterium]